MKRVLVLSDTHGLFRPELDPLLQQCDLIVHAGDIGDTAILARLRAAAPVLAVRGNNDHGPWAERLPLQVSWRLGRHRLHLVHDRSDLDPAVQADVVITGHSHRPCIEDRDGRLYLNPGSAGPRRFTLPVTVAELRLGDGPPEAGIVHLVGVKAVAHPDGPGPRGTGAARPASRPRRPPRR